MKRMIACVSLVAAATTAAASAVPSTTAHAASAHATSHATPAAVAKGKAKPTKCRVAPADEYFGKLKMSILGIRNVIKDQGLKIDVAPDQADTTISTMALTEDALHDWEHKYPCDTWLPGTIFALEHFYLKIHTDVGVRHVHATFAWLRRDYPRAKVVVLARREDGEATLATPAPAVDPLTATPAPLVPLPPLTGSGAPQPH